MTDQGLLHLLLDHLPGARVFCRKRSFLVFERAKVLIVRRPHGAYYKVVAHTSAPQYFEKPEQVRKFLESSLGYFDNYIEE